MKQFSLRLLIALSTFIIGVTTSMLWVLHRAPEYPVVPVLEIDTPLSKALPDMAVYSVSFCDLISDPHRYDRKLVRAQAIVETTIDSGWELTDDTCGRADVWMKIVDAQEPSDKSDAVLLASGKLYTAVRNLRLKGHFLPRVNIDFIGRFYAENKLNQMVILDIKDAKPAKKPDNDDFR